MTTRHERTTGAGVRRRGDSTEVLAGAEQLRDPGQPPRGRSSTQARREALAAYGFLTPWLGGMILLTIGPMVYSLYLSFTRYNLLTPPQWRGLENYQRMLVDPRFKASVGVTLEYVAVAV